MVGFRFGTYCVIFLFWKSTNRRSISPPRVIPVVSRQARSQNIFFYLALYKMKVADNVSDLHVSDSSESSTSDEEEFEDGFEIGFIDAYDGQTILNN